MPEIIRLAVPQDLPRLVEVSLASFGEVTWQRAVDRVFGPLNGRDWRDRWRLRVEKALQEQTILVLERGSELLGYACGTVDPAVGLGHIDILAVDPSVQGQGCGRRLLRAMEDYFLSQDAGHVSLEALVENDTANSLYRREGYRQMACHINWFKKLEAKREQ